MTIPAFLLAKLYVKGTLRNTEGGFEFQLRNVIDSTTLSGIGPFAANGSPVGPESIAVAIGDLVRKAADTSAANPVAVPTGVPVRVSVAGATLPAGPNRIGVVITSADAGRLAFDISDKVQ